jgi:hypothetical protein
MTQRFFTEVHLLAGKPVPIVAIHPLGGSRANRNNTPNPQPGAAQPTQDEIHKLLAIHKDAFCDLPRERLKNPSQSQDVGRKQSPLLLTNPPSSGPVR